MTLQPTRTRVLDTGLDLLSVEGVSGLSIGRVAGAAGLSKSGLFAHVRSKDQLAVELLDAAAQRADAAVVVPAMRAPPGLARLRTLIDGWLGWSARAGLSGGCPIAAALFEFDDKPGAVRDHVSSLDARWRALLVGMTQGAVATGEFRHDLDVDQFVWELSGIYLSHHASMRFNRDPSADERARRAIKELVARASAPADSGDMPS